VSVINILRQSGYQITLTLGVYDLFHVGHKRYLEAAKSQGDILVIAVDTDERARERKGPNRPFDTLNDRLEILAALRAVDIVTLRETGEDIRDFVKDLKPDTLIMSTTTKDFTQKDRQDLLRHCGRIKILEAQASTSTTSKLRRMMIEGAEQLAEEVTSLINNFLRGANDESSNSIHSSNTQRARRVLRKEQPRRTISTRKKSHR
jgi:D-beta-D-heptose 7-phosphate kinase/D-beta-D-heptose 1-phosphate adenosyltransferase